MTNEQIAWAEELFAEMVRYIEGEPTREKIEAAFYAALKQREAFKAAFLEDMDFRASVYGVLFDHALSIAKAA